MQIITHGFLLDMDGTTVDSNPVVEESWRRFCEPRGIDLTELLNFSHGRLTIATVEKYMPGASWDEIVAVNEEILEWESTANDGVTPIPGIPEFLNKIAELEAPWALVTSARESLARTRFQVTGLPWPEVVVTAERVENGKPDPSGYLLAAKELNLPAKECTVFEDAGPGISAGLAAGSNVVVVGKDASPQAINLPHIQDFKNVTITRGEKEDTYILHL